MCLQISITMGICLYYSESIYGVPPVLVQHLQKFPRPARIEHPDDQQISACAECGRQGALAD